MKISPAQGKDTYQQQEQLNKFTLPPSGMAIVVNRKLQLKTSKEGTKALRITPVILKAIDGDLKPFIGKSAPFDLWGKKGDDSIWSNEHNIQAMQWLAAAHHFMDDFDPDDKKQLARVITGVPYLFKWETESKTVGEKVMTNIRPLEFKHLSKAEREQFTNMPDWRKTAGADDDRWDDDYSPNAGGGARSGGHSDPDPFNSMGSRG